MTPLPPGVRSSRVDTPRLRIHHLESGPEDGIPVVLLHGNLSTSRFFEHLLPLAPERYRFIVPDMRGFGNTEGLSIDATRGLLDWAEDTRALLAALGITRPVHLAGWSTGGGAIAAYALAHPAASLTFIDPVSPFGFGGTRADGTPCCPDFAGSGGGIASPEFIERLDGGRPLRGVARVPAGGDEQLLLAAGTPRAARARGHARRRDPQVAHGRARLPRRLRAVRALAGRRPRRARDPQRALAPLLRLVAHREPLAQAARPVDARHARTS